MPLRSVEAATRDDAIAAAREQFGPSVRVVGVRRVRSGGVLGFFATERYVAEVAADPFTRPETSATPTPAETTGGFPSSPLSAAAPATAAPSSFGGTVRAAAPSSIGGTGRAAAPSRNGAAAYAAAAGQELADRSSTARGTGRPAEPPPRTAEPSIRPAEPAARPLPGADDPVSELAGLFADAPAAPPVTLYGPGSRAAAPLPPRGTAGSRDGVLPRVDVDEPRLPSGRTGLAAALDPAVFSPDAPSPFTAALARMAAGDRDVRDAVEVALDQPRVVRGRSTAGSWPSRSGSPRLEDTAAPSVPTRQEEEPVGDQVIAPPSIDAPHSRELPNWAAEPAPLAGSSREEAIAEALRSALAQGHSDEALAGILRKMLAGASPQTALAEPALGSLFQATPVVPAAPAVPEAAAPAVPMASTSPAPEAATRPAAGAAPTTMSLAMALANAGSAVPPAEVAAVEPVFPTAVVDVPAEPSMFEAPGEPAPDGAAELSAEPMEDPADVQPVELHTDVVPADVVPADLVPADVAATGEVPGDQLSEDQAHEHRVPELHVPELHVPELHVPEQHVPVYEPSVHRVPSYRSPSYESPLFDSPLFARPAADNTSMWGPSVASIWGEPTSSHVPLWGEPAPFSGAPYQADLPIWDDVVSGVRSDQFETSGSDALGTATEAELTPQPMAAPAAAEAAAPNDAVPADEVAVHEVPAEEARPASEDDVVESALPEPELAVLAPVFARTASDPAPLSLDATTVMPPLSLLPPLPGSRGSRGRPPVPPASPRSSSRTTGFPARRAFLPGTSLPTAERDVPAIAEPGPVPEAAPLDTTPLDTTPLNTTHPEATARLAPEEHAQPTTVEPVGSPESAPGHIDEVPELPVETTSMRAVENRAPRPADTALATVTRLPVATRAENSELPEIDLFEELDVPAETIDEESAAPSGQPELPVASGTVAALAALGLPDAVLGEDFAGAVDTIGTYAALTRALSLRLPVVPELPGGAGDVLFVVGPGVETLRAARTLAAGSRLDPESVQWATRGDLAGLAPRDSRMTTVETARQRRQSTVDAGTVTIVAVDVPLRTDAYWMEQMLAVWSPVAVWAVVEATRKPEDLDRWLAGLTAVDALILTDTDLSGEPAAALRRADTPVALVDGVRATPHRWASLLCERLEAGRA